MKRSEIIKTLSGKKSHYYIETRDGFIVSVYKEENLYSISRKGMSLSLGDTARLLSLPQNQLYFCIQILSNMKIDIFDLVSISNNLLQGIKHYD